MTLANLLPIMLCFIFVQSQMYICHNIYYYILTQAGIFFILDTFRSSSKLLNTFTEHNTCVNSIDYSIFDCSRFICSGSDDKTVRVWDVDNNKQIQPFNQNSSYVSCVKFSSYHYHSHRQNVICFSSSDDTIHFWDFKNNQQLQMFNGHTGSVYDNTIRLWD
ncbi:WD-40 repeat-containing protein, partial [Reticulomyxa filosa]